MIKRIKKIGILIVAFMTMLVGKINAVVIPEMEEEAQSLIKPSPMNIFLSVLNYIIIPLMILLGIIIIIIDWNKLRKLKKTKRNINELQDIEELKKKYKESIVISIIAIFTLTSAFLIIKMMTSVSYS